MSRSPCQGAIKRYGTDYLCPASAKYAVRNNNDHDVVRGACRHHLTQVIDSMEAESVLVVPLDRSTQLTTRDESSSVVN